MKVFVILILSYFMLNGCAARISQSNLYWGNYSHTLYKVKKEPSEKTNKAHEKELQSIVDQSKKLNLKIPPGVYAELGIFAMERGDANAAKNYFRLEQDTYPEGRTLMRKTFNMQSDDG